jgi:hypothetical protein
MVEAKVEKDHSNELQLVSLIIGNIEKELISDVSVFLYFS